MNLIDSLQALNYKQLFKQLNLLPLHTHYFAIQALNPNEQFYCFSTLAAWLIRLNGGIIAQPEQFDDPNATIAALRQMNVLADVSSAKLRIGYGATVIELLSALASLGLSKLPKPKQPKFKNDEMIEEAVVDEDAEIIAETYDHISENDDDDHILAVTAKKAVNKKQSTLIQDSIQFDMQDWMLELERVTPLLKIHIANDNKDWRIHQSQLQKFLNETKSSFGASKTQLEALNEEISKGSVKIQSREKYLSNHFESQESEHRAIANEHSLRMKDFTISNTRVEELTLQLTEISDQIESHKVSMDEIGSGLTDSKPLTNIKAAVLKLKGEIKQMNLRIGVLDHELLSGKYTHKRHQFDNQSQLLTL